MMDVMPRPQSDRTTKQISLRLETSMLDEIDADAATYTVAPTRSYIITLAIREHLDRRKAEREAAQPPPTHPKGRKR